jgi:hypothetical protein
VTSASSPATIPPALLANHRWLRGTLLGVVIAFIVIGLLGFLLVPPLVEGMAQRRLEALLGRRVQIGFVRADPFALTLTVQNLQVFEPDATTVFAGFSRLHLDAQWSSIYRRAPVLRQISLDGPWIKLVRFARPAGHPPRDRYNVSDIVARLSRRPEDPPRQERPHFSLARIRIAEGEVQLDDRKLARRHRLSGLEIRLPFLSTLPVDLDTALLPALRVDLDGAPFAIEGRAKPFSQRRESSAQVRIDGFDLTRLMPYLPRPLPYELTSARLEARVEIAFVRPPDRAPEVKLGGRVTLEKVRLRRSGQPGRLGVEQLHVVIGAAGITPRLLDLGRVDLQGVDLAARRRPDGTVDLGPLLPPPPSGRAPTSASGGGPQVRIGVLALRDLALRLGPSDQPLRLDALDLAGFAVDPESRIAFAESLRSRGGELRVRRNPDGLLDLTALRGPRSPSPPARVPDQPGARPWTVGVGRAGLDGWTLRFTDLAVRPARSLTAAHITLTASRINTLFGTRGAVDLRAGLPPRGQVKLRGALGLRPFTANLDVRLAGLGLLPAQPYLGRRLDLLLTGGTLAGKGKLEVKAAAGPTPVPHLRFRGDLHLDRFATVDGRTREPLLGWRALQLAGLSLATAPTAIAIQQIALDGFFSRLVVFPDSRLNLPRLRPSPAPSRPGPPAPRPRIALERVELRGGRISVLDRSVRPSFFGELANLYGQVSGLSSDARTRARVDLRGTIDATGLVQVAGSVNPLSGQLLLDLRADVRDVELAPASPYAAKYLGYPIREGKLGLSLGYLLLGRRLEARNHLRFEQLTLGDEVASPRATKLPVRLAVALLTDRHGVIDLDVPIAGSLDDPDFEPFSSIAQALGRHIARAATAPFSLVASASGGGEELSRIEFAPGLATLDSRAQEKIRALARILHERPALRFEIQGSADPRRDRPEGAAPADGEALRVLAGRRALVVRDALARLEHGGLGRLFLVSPRTADGGRVELRLK